MLPLLEFAKDGEPHLVTDAEKSLAGRFKLTKKQREVLKPSGKEPLFLHRLRWARTYLRIANLIKDPKKGYYQITQQGINVLREKPVEIDTNYLRRFSEFNKWFGLVLKRKKKTQKSKIKKNEQLDLETLDKKYQTNQILTLVKKEFRRKNIIESTSILHGALEKHLLLIWSLVSATKFNVSPFDKIDDKYNTNLGFKELTSILYQTGIIQKELFHRLMRFNSLRNNVIHEMMKLELVRKKTKLENIRNEFGGGIICYKELKKLKDIHSKNLRNHIRQNMNELVDSLAELSDRAKKHGISLQ